MFQILMKPEAVLCFSFRFCYEVYNLCKISLDSQTKLISICFKD